MNRSNRAAIIGLDGATMRVLAPMIESGAMPTLARLMREGATGKLMTTRPPVTCPAWPTMYTGVNPGKHGVFSFSYREPDTQVVRTAASGDVHAPTIWDLAGDAGKRVAILNVPITFPASKVNGVMLTGFVSPEDSEQIAYPHTFGQELKDQFTQLSLNWAVLGHRPSQRDLREAHIRRINDLLQHRCRKFEWVFDRGEFDFAFIVHEYTDRVHHLFYHILEPGFAAHANPDNAGSLQLLRDGHRMLDDSIARLVSSFGEDANFLFVSDHGFEAVTHWVYVNNLLEQHGLVRIKARAWADVISRRYHLPPSFRQRFGLEQKSAWHRVDPRCAPLIDYPHSQAFAGPQLEHAVYVNLAGRDPQGRVKPGAEYERVRHKIVDVLSSAIDPETGGKVFEGVWTREEIYHGPYLQNAPDIIYELSRKYMVSNAILPPALLRGRFIRPLRAGWNISGYHRPEGILVAHGPAFKKCKFESANILDIAPTVLYLMGLEVPSYMDGRIFQPALREDLLEREPPAYAQRDLNGAVREQSVYTREEQMEVTRRLEELGYL